MPVNTTLPTSEIDRSCDTVVDQNVCPMTDTGYVSRCKRGLDERGVLLLPDFLTTQTITEIVNEGMKHHSLAYSLLLIVCYCLW